jgi:dTDP-4-amino-4,6-dideoxygalactose transaminase
MTAPIIPFSGLSRQYRGLKDQILDVTDQVLSSGHIMNGPWTQAFETWLAEHNDVPHAITCHSGTSALEIIAEYHLQNSIQRSPCALIPNLTYPATANAFMRAGWDIGFVDTDIYGCIDPDKIPLACDYDLVVLVGLYGSSITHLGSPRHWQRWYRSGTVVIEDAAQHWLSSGGDRIGHSAAVSFDPMKNLPAYGNGGAVLTHDDRLAAFARDWRDNGKIFRHDSVGTNSRMSEIECACMMIKTRYINAWQCRRRDIAAYFISRFFGTPIRCLIDDTNFNEHSFHKFVIDVDNRDRVKDRLAEKGIECRVHYAQTLSEMGSFRQWSAPDMLSVSVALSRRVLSLPIYPELTDSEIEYIADQVLDCVNNPG